MHIKTWHVDIYVQEQDGDATAHAILRAESDQPVNGHGFARQVVPAAVGIEITEELAAARALRALSDALTVTVSHDVDAVLEEPARLAFSSPVGSV